MRENNGAIIVENDVPLLREARECSAVTDHRCATGAGEALIDRKPEVFVVARVISHAEILRRYVRA